MNGERYLLVLAPVGPGPPAAVRLRRFLKLALRGHGLRCIRIELQEEVDDEQGNDQGRQRADPEQAADV